MFYEHWFGSRAVLSGRKAAWKAGYLLFERCSSRLNDIWGNRKARVTHLLENCARWGPKIPWKIPLKHAVNKCSWLWHEPKSIWLAQVDAGRSRQPRVSPRLAECFWAAICIQGTDPHFHTGAAREPSHRDFSQHLSLSLYLPLTQPQFAFIHLNQWQGPGYFNWRNNSISGLNMRDKSFHEHGTWNVTKLLPAKAIRLNYIPILHAVNPVTWPSVTNSHFRSSSF